MEIDGAVMGSGLSSWDDRFFRVEGRTSRSCRDVRVPSKGIGRCRVLHILLSSRAKDGILENGGGNIGRYVQQCHS